MALLTLASVLFLVPGLTKPRRRSHQLAILGLGVGAISMVLAPSLWAASTLNPRYNGSWADAGAGPSLVQVRADPVTLTDNERRILDYTLANGHGVGYPFATDDWYPASRYIAATGAKILPIGGFSRTAPQPTLAEVQHLVRTGRLRFFLLNSDSELPTGIGENTTAISTWVTGRCAVVPPSAYAVDKLHTGRAHTSGTLYQCRP